MKLPVFKYKKAELIKIRGLRGFFLAENNLGAEALSKGLNLKFKKWDSLPSQADLEKTISALEKNNMAVIVAENSAEAMKKLAETIPSGSEIMNGSSTTLIEIGFVDFLRKNSGKWKNLHEEILAEKDSSKQAGLRRKSMGSEYFVSGVNAITKKGELVACDASGSRTGAFNFAAKNLVIVSGTNKIVKNLSEAMKRIGEFAFPLENARAKEVYGIGSSMNKFSVLRKEAQPGRTTVILVKEKLGY